MLRFTGLSFKPDFKARSQNDFQRAQKLIDNEVLKKTEPYMPKRTGTMIRSGTLGTVPGSGVIEYTAPYARQQYYTNLGKGMDGVNAVKGTKGLRGPFGFERMKVDHFDEIRQKLKENFNE